MYSSKLSNKDNQRFLILHKRYREDFSPYLLSFFMRKKANIGDELRVRDVIFKVNEVSTTTEINDGQFISYKPNNDGAIFYLVNITIRNAGQESITTDTSFFELHKDKIKYSPSRIITADSGFFYYEGINPGLSQTGSVTFEVPQKESGFVLQVQTGMFGTEKGEINLQ